MSRRTVLVERFTIRANIVVAVLCALTTLGPVSAGTTTATQSARPLKGKFSKEIYTSPDGDYRVAAPNAKVLGFNARDEGEDEIWQVIFTDDFGGFYRLVSLKNPKEEMSAEDVLNMKTYATAFDKEVVKSERGNETRFSHVEPHGAEMTITSSRNPPDGSITWDTSTPDLVTANSVFEANGRIYHVIAGVTMTDIGIPEITKDSPPVFASANQGKLDQPTAVRLGKERLQKLLNGFQLVTSLR